jgi:transcriptional regulator with XRE-family HTH domain
VHALPDDDAWIAHRRHAIGDRLRDERLRQNLTQDQVWLAARVSRYTLQRAEGGQDVHLSTLLRIMCVLGIPFADLD